MSGPKLMALDLGTYTLDWDDDNVRCVVKGAKRHTSDGRVTGQLTVQTVVGGDVKHLYATQFNFLSMPTKKQLERTLKERLAGVDWYRIIEQLCDRVVEAASRGDPVRVLRTQDEYQRPEHLLYPLLLKREPNVLYGEAESAKSLTGLLCATLMALPYHRNGLGLEPSCRATPLVLDWETNYDEYGHRLKMLQRGLGLPDYEIAYRRCYSSLADDIEPIRNMVREEGAECVIVDSLAGAAGGDLNKSEVALPVFAALRQLDVSSVILAHTAKGLNDEPTIFGSVWFHNYARQVWLMRRSSEVGSDEVHIGLYHKKGNNTGRAMPFGLRYEFRKDEDMVKVSRMDLHEDDVLAQGLGTGARLLAILRRDGPQKPDTMAEALGITGNAARQALYRMKVRTRNGSPATVVELPDGRYGAAMQDPQDRLNQWEG